LVAGPWRELRDRSKPILKVLKVTGLFFGPPLNESPDDERHFDAAHSTRDEATALATGTLNAFSSSDLLPGAERGGFSPGCIDVPRVRARRAMPILSMWRANAAWWDFRSTARSANMTRAVENAGVLVN
jgi:hypothetical protein